jgi:hypothetical protein
MLSVMMLSVIMLSVIMLSVIMLNVFMLSVVMLSVVMLSIVAPFLWASISGTTKRFHDIGTWSCLRWSGSLAI